MHDHRLDDDFDPLAAETFTSAHELYQRMRAECPVAHSTRVHTDTFTTSVRNVVPKFAFTGRRPPPHFDPPERTVHRRVINRSLTAHAARHHG